MDVRSLNKFNVVVNTVSGNFLPLTADNTGLGLTSAAYFIFVWFIDITYVATTLIGLICYMPALEAVKSGGATVVICVELFFLLGHLRYRRKCLCNFIRKMNSILVDSDDLRRCIRDSMKHHEKPLKLYALMNMSTWLIWEALPLAKILQTDQFTYTDFKITTYFPGSPFTVTVFVLGILFRAVGSSNIMLKKIGIDIYVNYYIILLTAQLQYLKERLAAALREEDEILVIKALKDCVVYHCNAMKLKIVDHAIWNDRLSFARMFRRIIIYTIGFTPQYTILNNIFLVLRTGKILVDVLSVNVGVIYFNCIFRFCCISFMIINLRSPLNILLTVVFLLGSVMQVYLLCSSIQGLLEASTSITNDAFYENWYERGPTARSIFLTMGLSNQMECRLTAFGIYDLTVPTLATILKQSYSACLLLMGIQ